MLTAAHSFHWKKAAYVSALLFSSSGRKKQCNILLELLKKFQSCRGHLSNTMQRAEQAIGDQASYMGKDNLQRSIAKVRLLRCYEQSALLARETHFKTLTVCVDMFMCPGP